MRPRWQESRRRLDRGGHSGAGNRRPVDSAGRMVAGRCTTTLRATTPSHHASAPPTTRPTARTWRDAPPAAWYNARPPGADPGAWSSCSRWRSCASRCRASPRCSARARACIPLARWWRGADAAPSPFGFAGLLLLRRLIGPRQYCPYRAHANAHAGAAAPGHAARPADDGGDTPWRNQRPAGAFYPRVCPRMT